MEKYRWLPLAALLAGTLALWPLRDQLTAERIAAWSPREAGLAAVFLLVLYALKSLSVAFPLSALEAAGGLLFPLPAALAVNLLGVLTAQVIPEADGEEPETAVYLPQTFRAENEVARRLRDGESEAYALQQLR